MDGTMDASSVYLLKGFFNHQPGDICLPMKVYGSHGSDQGLVILDVEDPKTQSEHQNVDKRIKELKFEAHFQNMQFVCQRCNNAVSEVMNVGQWQCTTVVLDGGSLNGRIARADHGVFGNVVEPVLELHEEIVGMLPNRPIPESMMKKGDVVQIKRYEMR